LIKSYEETLVAFETAKKGDLGVEETTTMINSRTEEILLLEYERLKKTGSKIIKLELYFWNTKLPAEHVESGNLLIKAGGISITVI
jgi:hypothetical protein